MIFRSPVIECSVDGILFEPSDIMKKPHGFRQYHILIRQTQGASQQYHVPTHMFRMLLLELDDAVMHGIIRIETRDIIGKPIFQICQIFLLHIFLIKFSQET